MKSVIKEILIIILLCCAVCLILGVVFYDYIPTNKVIPSQVQAYQTSNTIKDEISQGVSNYEAGNYVFEITDSDLSLYRQSDSYDPGKANPFASSALSENTTTNTVTEGTNTGNTTSNGNTTNNSSSSTSNQNNNTTNNSSSSTSNQNNNSTNDSNSNKNSSNNSKPNNTNTSTSSSSGSTDEFFKTTGLK